MKVLEFEGFEISETDGGMYDKHVRFCCHHTVSRGNL